MPFFQGNADFGFIHPIETKWCNSPKKVAEKNDILLSIRAPVGDLNIANQKCCIGRGLAAIRSKKANNEFLYFYLLVNKNRLAKVEQGSTLDAINRKDILFFKVAYPPINEQKRIAEILLSVDAAIGKIQKVIDKTKELKRGLMQELFTKGIGHKKILDSIDDEIKNAILDKAKLQGIKKGLMKFLLYGKIRIET